MRRTVLKCTANTSRVVPKSFRSPVVTAPSAASNRCRGSQTSRYHPAGICNFLKRYYTLPIPQTSLLQAAEAEEVDAGGGPPVDEEETGRGAGDGGKEATGEEEDEEGRDAGLASRLAVLRGGADSSSGRVPLEGGCVVMMDRSLITCVMWSEYIGGNMYYDGFR